MLRQIAIDILYTPKKKGYYNPQNNYTYVIIIIYIRVIIIYFVQMQDAEPQLLRYVYMRIIELSSFVAVY